MELTTTTAILITAAGTAVTVIAEHFTFGKWWQSHELARRTLGHATLLAWALVLVAMNVITITAWLAFLFLTGAAGATLAAITVTEEQAIKQKLADLAQQQNEPETNDQQTD